MPLVENPSFRWVDGQPQIRESAVLQRDRVLQVLQAMCHESTIVGILELWDTLVFDLGVGLQKVQVEEATVQPICQVDAVKYYHSAGKKKISSCQVYVEQDRGPLSNLALLPRRLRKTQTSCRPP